MRKLLITLVLSLNFFSYSQKEYFDTYQILADSLEGVYGIPSSVMLSIAYHESGGGKSRNAKLLNNHHGIKGSNNLLKTHKIKSKYRQFASVEESYVGFCELVTRKKVYGKLKGEEDVSKWVYGIYNSGYCSSKKWPVAILGIIKKNKLS